MNKLFLQLQDEFVSVGLFDITKNKILKLRPNFRFCK